MNEENFYCNRCMNKLTSKVNFCPVCGHKTYDINLLKFALKPKTLLNNRYSVLKIISTNEKTISYLCLDENLESKVEIVEFYPNEMVSRLEKKVIVKNYYHEEYVNGLKNNFLELHKNLINLRFLTNMLKIYAYFEENNTVYIVQEFVRGITFSKYLANNYGELTWEHSKNMFLNLINLLRNLHSKKIIHTDLTPNNLAIENNILKIISFENAIINYENFKEKKFKLNEGYSAPEQYEGKNIGTHTDVYSLAALIYKTLTGTKPVNSTSRISNDNLLPPNVLNSKIPKNVSFATMSALVLAPKLRTQTMKDFYEDLTAPPREYTITKEENFQKEIKKIKKSKKTKKIKKNKESKPYSKKEKNYKSLIFKSLLISCSIISFFLVLTLFLLFNENMFD